MKIIKKIFESKITTILLSIVLSLITVILIFSSVISIMDSNYIYEHDEYSFEYRYKDGNFFQCLTYKKENNFNGIEANTASMKEYYALADYYEAAINYKLATSNNTDTEKYKKLMDEKESEIVMYGYYIDDINKILNIE